MYLHQVEREKEENAAERGVEKKRQEIRACEIAAFYVNSAYRCGITRRTGPSAYSTASRIMLEIQEMADP